MAALQAQARYQVSDGERAEQELRDFSYLVAHDLANEFRHVAEFSKLLGEDLADDAQGTSYAQAIAQSAGRCQSMLRAILAYSSIQTQAMQPRLWPGRSVVERALAELAASDGGHPARISIDVVGDVFADARLLIMAVRLGLANALQFGREGADLAIDVKGALDKDGGWRLEIADNGEGLPRQYHEKAFGMFWRLDPSAPGVGAGLPTIRRIARRHGGEARLLEAVEGVRLEIAIPAKGAFNP